MTLGEGKRKVLMLIDEYSSGGAITEDKDINAKMVDFFDLAQKQVASYRKIIRDYSVPLWEPRESAARFSGERRSAGVSELSDLAESEGYGGRDDEEGCALYPMPADFGSVFRVWRDGALTRKYAWRGNSIWIPEGDAQAVTVEYFAVPATIPFDAPDSYEFEVDEDAAACMPYFVAAQQLVVDLILDPAPLLELYERMLSTLDMRRPSAGGGGVRQTLFR